MTLGQMAQEYRSNTALLELRMKELQVAQRRAGNREVKYRLKRRIGCLRVMINESRNAVFAMEQYCERGTRHADKHAV